MATGICDKCQSYGLSFKRNYDPSEFLVGKPDSLIWIVGLNPKGEEGFNDSYTVEELRSYFDRGIHSYFRDFRKVSPRLYALMGKSQGVAHTDLVKCYSNDFPPKSCRRFDAQKIVENCYGYLVAQIQKHKPRILICNGSSASRVLTEVLPPSDQSERMSTSYLTRTEENEIAVILSGFIGRIDDYAKRRLGVEIETYMSRFGI